MNDGRANQIQKLTGKYMDNIEDRKIENGKIGASGRMDIVTWFIKCTMAVLADVFKTALT